MYAVTMSRRLFCSSHLKTLTPSSLQFTAFTRFFATQSGGSINDVGNRFLKQQRGRMKGNASGDNNICFGEYALQALEPAWITSRQIEAGRRAMSRNVAMSKNVCRGGKIWVRMFPHKSVTARPTETRMGKGKGSIKYTAAVVKPGKILYEIGGVPENIARKAIALAASKLPIRTQSTGYHRDGTRAELD